MPEQPCPAKSHATAVTESALRLQVLTSCPLLTAGLGFTGIERLLTMGTAGSNLESLFRSNKELPADKVRPAVHQAATNLVGMLHVLIVVRFLLCQLQLCSMLNWTKLIAVVLRFNGINPCMTCCSAGPVCCYLQYARQNA